MTAVVSFLVVIVVAVFVHEMGHYLAARAFGVRVVRFSVGFGPALARRVDKLGTEWVLAPIPLGGYVQMMDADAAKRAGVKHEQSLEGVSNWRRFIIFAAGPFANLVLTAVLAAILAMQGELGLKPVVGKVIEGSPAAKAGARRGEVIAEVNGEPIALWFQTSDIFLDAIIAGEDIEWTTTSGARRVIPAGALSVDGLNESGFYQGLGMFPDQSFISPTLSAVVPGGAADKAGIRAGDAIVLIGDEVIDEWLDLRHAVSRRPGQATPIVVFREQQAITLTATMGERLRGNKRIGMLGVRPTVIPEKAEQMGATLRLDFFPAVAEGARKSGEYVARTFAVLWLILTGNLSADNISGPVGIAVHAGNAAEGGVAAFLRFLSFISASLAAINLVPLPLLDGGQMVVCIIQAARRRPLSPKVVELLGRVGGALLLALMITVIINDIYKLWGG